jgi:hypothetical protein
MGRDKCCCYHRDSVALARRRRAFALGHALNGANVGGVLFAPLWVTLIAAIGFTAAVVGVVTLAVPCPLTWRYLRPTPDSFGVAPDGDSPPTAQRTAAPSTHRPAQFVALLANLKFTTLSIAFALGMFAQVGVVAHLIASLAPIVGIGSSFMPEPVSLRVPTTS